MFITGKSQGIKRLGVKLKKKKKANNETFIDYTESSSLHGISYAFERNVHCWSRIFWTLICLGFFSLGVVMILQVYNDWRGSPVLTTVGDPAYPVTDIEFPAIVICGLGSLESRMHKALAKQIHEKVKYDIGYGDEYEDYDYEEFVDKFGMETITGLYKGLGTVDLVTMASLFKALSPQDYIKAGLLLNDFHKHCDKSSQKSGDESGDWSGEESGFQTGGWSGHQSSDENGGWSGHNSGDETGGRSNDDNGDETGGWSEEESGDWNAYDSSATVDERCGEQGYYDEVNHACYFFYEEWETAGGAETACSKHYLMTSFSIMSDRQLRQLIKLLRKGSIQMSIDTPIWTLHKRDSATGFFHDYGKNLTELAPSMLSIEVGDPTDDKNCLSLAYDEDLEKFLGSPTLCEDHYQVLCESAPEALPNCTGQAARENLVDLILNPKKAARTEKKIKDKNLELFDLFDKINVNEFYSDLVELLWHSQLPCHDTENSGDLSLIKQCFWKSEEIACETIFTPIPTDRGMCCSFNLKNAENMFNPSKYVNMVTYLQDNDKYFSYWRVNEIENEMKEGEPKPSQGLSKGLTLVLDAHTNMISRSSVNEDFQGFIAMVNAKDNFPVTDQNNIKILPGYENFVAISAYDVRATESFRKTLSSTERNCYYQDEKELQLFLNYTKDACIMECQMTYVMSKLESDPEFGIRCVPWYLPEFENISVCKPWDANKFREYLKLVPDDACSKECLPDCERTFYSTKLSQAQFRRCDNKNLGLSHFCQLKFDPDILPAIYGEDVLDEYDETEAKANYLHAYTTVRRHYSENTEKEIFYESSRDDEKGTYNSYEKDIAKVHFYFDQSSVVQYMRQPSMTLENFLSQVGGLLGLCLGFSFISMVELIYWITYRIWWSPKRTPKEEEK